MSEAVLQVTAAGPLVSVQDGGRPGLMRYGVPASGPMDRLALSAANLALGNEAGAPGIEVSLGGVTLDCLQGAVGFAVAGGGFIVEHRREIRSGWTTGTLSVGERLRVRPGPWGSWCCIAFAGWLQVPTWLGSASTHALSGLGGGRISTGDRLSVAGTLPWAEGPIACPVFARPRAHLRATLGPQQRFFAVDAITALASGDWRMTEAGDRMGVRLAGPPIPPAARLDMPSEPIARGSVQVSGDGVATVLLADHQTTGGYPKIATVLDCDLDALVQLRPRDRLGLELVTADAATAIARTRARAIAAYLAALRARAGASPAGQSVPFPPPLL